MIIEVWVLFTSDNNNNHLPYIEITDGPMTLTYEIAHHIVIFEDVEVRHE